MCVKLNHYLRFKYTFSKMDEEKLKSLSLDELTKKAKSTKQTTNFLAGIVLVLYIVTIYGSIRTGEFDFIMLVAIAFTFTIFSNYRKVRKMEDEMASRNVS